ncbi:uncharacterized protein Z520_11461 [Fonsecaea multimorphosa CBS 102226]|uniref:EthD domain-containing protein n=1 Tax=Fonsecaea multimorphosa CBS 102226 TaxID=1442371 RepID=A0A0D2K8X1_9EURO|nr:uncharacterized protein Z520_11461 [Fonsecaea multimorphosa CBS 102226]KIX92798.1 hypothetical protein Z520_11461 [Fonsecaea multimorphosa CBS 102226]OAL18046.1 hypothetical protein AYO22_11062 [Fonsecaea multimorphosa]
MAAASYLFRVLSEPTGVERQSWEKWYCSENIPSLVNAKAVARAGLYEAFDDYPLTTKTPNVVSQTSLHDVTVTHTDIEPPTEKTFLAMCQVEDPTLAKEQHLQNIDQSTESLGGKSPKTCAVWDSRVYKLIQDFDPKSIGHTPAPFILNVQMEPADDDDYNTFYRDEHLYMLSRVPGYRRSQRYQLVSSDNISLPAVPRFMAVHEFETLDHLDGPELREADASPNTHRVIGNSKATSVRGFKLVKVFGDMSE